MYGKPELERSGLSHYLSLEQAAAFNTQDSRVARVTVAPSAGHFAAPG
jgi:hypothetical protein